MRQYEMSAKGQKRTTIGCTAKPKGTVRGDPDPFRRAEDHRSGSDGSESLS